ERGSDERGSDEHEGVDAVTVVCVLGFGAPPASLTVSAPVIVPPVPGAAALVDTLRPPLDAGEVVIAPYPAWQPDPWLRNLQVVRSVLGTDALVGAPVDLPPLAGAVFGGL